MLGSLLHEAAQFTEAAHPAAYCGAHQHCKLGVVSVPSPDEFCGCAGLRIKETKEVYEGEVTELTPVETENPVSGGVHLYRKGG